MSRPHLYEKCKERSFQTVHRAIPTVYKRSVWGGCRTAENRPRLVDAASEDHPLVVASALKVR